MREDYNMAGRLWGVGVGPGDPMELTVKAVDTIKNCDIIAVPGRDISKVFSYSIVKNAIKDIEKKQVLCLEMPMSRDKAVLSEAHSQAAKKVADELDKGKNVAFLTLGDPCIYSTYIYIQRIIEKMGYKTGIVNGIPAMCAAGAIFNIPLGLEEEEIHIIPFLQDVSKLTTLEGTKVVMKPSANYEAIKKYIIEKKLSAVMVENAGMDAEKRYYNVEEFPENTGYFTTIIVR